MLSLFVFQLALQICHMPFPDIVKFIAVEMKQALDIIRAYISRMLSFCAEI